MKNHKEYMKQLKEYDPMTYYELTSNPTGADCEDINTGLFIVTLIITLFLALIFLIVSI